MKRFLLRLTGIALGLWLVMRLVAREVPREVPPLYPDFVPDDFAPELFEFETSDGVTLRGKRYQNAGATPLILMAGFMGNGFNYDVAIEECNFALYLARRGYDVWVANFRGTGREPYKSDCEGFDHSIEDIAVYDVPALVAGVTRETGIKPVIFGHSMGGVVSYGFLQGVVFEDEGGRRRLKPDPELASRRNEEVAGLVSIAGPVCFRFPRRTKHYYMLGSPIARLYIRGARALVGSLVNVAPQIPVEQLIFLLFRISPRLAFVLTRMALDNFFNIRNTTTEHFLETVISGGSDVSMMEAYQLLDALISQDFTEASTKAGGLLDAPYNFTENIVLVKAPVLFVVGGRDAVDSQCVYEWGFERVASEKKDYVCFDDYGHIDLLMGKDAARTVFPYVGDWLDSVLEG
jgi:pimeloyl-ACP methyl ester carboxylesterase